MAITLVSTSSSQANAGAGTLAANLPTSFAPDDLLVLAVWHAAAAALGTPAGYSEVYDGPGPNGHLGVYAKIAGASESSPAVSFAGAAGTDTWLAQMAAFRGTDLTTPVEVVGSGFSSASTANIGPIPGVSPSGADGAVIVVGGRRDDHTSVDLLTGDGLTWTELGEPDSTTGTDAGMVWDVGTWTGAAPTITDKTFTMVGGAAAPAQGVMFALQPPAGPPPPPGASRPVDWFDIDLVPKGWF